MWRRALPARQPGPRPGRRPQEDQCAPGARPVSGPCFRIRSLSGSRAEHLLIKLTPLDEEIIRLTAPDTYETTTGLGRNPRTPSIQNRHGVRASLFLVSLFSYQPDVTYEPEDLLLVNRGLRLRPQGIAPISPSWGTQRLGQQEARMAVYAFEGGIEWEADLVAEYQQLRNETWQDQIVPVLEAERAKVRARAGGGWQPAPEAQSSNPNFLIFRYRVRSPISKRSAAFRRFPPTSSRTARMASSSSSSMVIPGR